MADTCFLRDGKWPIHVFYSVPRAGKLPTIKNQYNQSSSATRTQIFRNESKNAKDSLFGHEGHLFAKHVHFIS